MKLNFFARIYLAITDFRLYPFIVQKERFVSAFAYFVCFILLISAILSAGVTAKIINWTRDFSNNYDSYVKGFSISNGFLDMNENIDKEFANVKIYTDDTRIYESGELINFDADGYKMVIYAMKNSVAIGNPDYGFVLMKYSDLNMDTNAQRLHEILRYSLESPLFKLSLTGAIFCGVFTAYFFTKFMNAVGITLMLMFLGWIFRTDYKFKHYLKVAFYVITLPVITETIGIIVTGAITEYAYITYYLLVYVYMYYAIRALKLDNIIMTTQEKIMGMKMNEESDVNIEKDDSIFSKENSNDENKKDSNKENKSENEENDDNMKE